MIENPEITRFREYIETLAHGDEADMLAAAYASPAVHFALYCRIRDQDNVEIDPMPNILQLRMSEAYETIKSMGIRVRIICTKPRRAGCSSFVEHIGYHSAMRDPIHGMTIADDKPGSEAAMRKLASFATMDTFPWGVKGVATAHNIAWSNGSTWIVDTAENADAGAGDTLQFFHGTEVSKWPKTSVKNDDKVMSCVAPALSGVNTTMFCESTPEGAVGWQYNTWLNAVWLDDLIVMRANGICPEEVWVKVFAAWFEFASNSRQSAVSEQEIAHFQATLDDTERFEIDKYKLTWEQIGWRRDTIKSKCGGNPKVFSYYFPSDDVSCWLSSGQPVFDQEVVTEMLRRAIGKTPDTGHLVTQQDGETVVLQMSRDGTGDIFIWEAPKIGLKYCLVLDPASNKSQTIGKDTDAHSISVWRAGYFDTLVNRWMPSKKVARVRPPYRADGDEVAGHVVRLSKFYGRCIVAQEVNIGLDILRLLEHARIPLYRRKPLSHRTGNIEEQIGFKLTFENREAIIQGLVAAIRNRDIEVFCEHTLKEYQSFIRKPNGRAEAAQGKHDDDVLADCMAWEIMPSATEYRVHQAKHQDPADMKSWKRTTRLW